MVISGDIDTTSTQPATHTRGAWRSPAAGSPLAGCHGTPCRSFVSAGCPDWEVCPSGAMSRRCSRWWGGFRFWFTSRRWEWSPEEYRMHGYEPGEIVPTTALLLSHKHLDDRHHVAEAITRSIEQGEPFSSRHRFLDTSGAVHTVMVVADRLVDDTGHPAGYYIPACQGELRPRVTATSATECHRPGRRSSPPSTNSADRPPANPARLNGGSAVGARPAIGWLVAVFLGAGAALVGRCRRFRVFGRQGAGGAAVVLGRIVVTGGGEFFFVDRAGGAVGRSAAGTVGSGVARAFRAACGLRFLG
ncbi:PAS domain-containing protein [Nocardia sp. BMG111209]|uniref:PAS domain-containing protein n=1 Tax=Nocardia sp. BMG111209 TaxID=1160137 RepID=UPI00350F9D6E